MFRVACLVLCAGCATQQIEPAAVGMTEPMTSTPQELRVDGPVPVAQQFNEADDRLARERAQFRIESKKRRYAEEKEREGGK